ncbi:high mobility group box domain-containing protein, partial [Mycena rosella]
HIPRPPNAFILFRSSLINSQCVSTEVETNHSTLSKIIGMAWKNLPDDERQVWRHKAMDAVAEHKRNFPTYVFRP